MRAAQLGIHLFVWGAEWQNEAFDLPRVLETCRRLGFAGVELPWLRPLPSQAVAAAARAVAAAGLWATVSTALPPQACLVDPDRAAAGVQWLDRAAEVAAAFGSPVLCGPLLAPVGELPAQGRDPLPAVAPLAAAAEAAAANGVRLCVEPLNRYETDVLHTLSEGELLCRQSGGGVALLADTYHENIEEQDPLGALERHLPWVGHVHLSENHRGPVGSGHIPWGGVAAVLDAAGYSGRAVVEGFNAHVPTLARATCIWRAPASSPEAFAAASAQQLRSLFR